MIVIFLKDLKKLGDVIVKVNGHKPDTLESYDDNTLKLGIKFFPQLLKILKPKSMLVMIWRLLPNIWILLTRGIPKMIIMAEFAGENEEEVFKKLKDVEAELKPLKVKTRITKSEDEEEEFWVIRRESFNLLRKKIKKLHTAPFIDDIIVRPEFLPEFLPKLEGILGQYKLKYTIFGHPGDGNFHIIPLMNLSDPRERSLIPKLADQVYSLVLEYKGSITAEHNDGLIRTPYLTKMYGAEVVGLFEKTKNIFDPKNIFNPGKKVNPLHGYSMSHIKTDWEE